MKLKPALRAALMSLSLVLPGLVCAAPFDLDALMRGLSEVKSGEAVFTEERHVLQLDQKLLSSGRLRFTAPDTFIRETLKPRQERLAVIGNQLTMSQGSRSRSTLLDSVPEAVVIVEAVRGTLTGNRETLDRLFTTNLQGSAQRWQLELVPRDVRLRGQVSQLRLTGQHAQVREVRIIMADGDYSVMKIEPLAKTPAGVTPQ